MPTRQINARDLIVELSDMAAVPVWNHLGGLQTGTVSYSENEEFTDTVTWDNAGHFSQEKMQLGGKISLEGRYLQDPVSGVRDVGQALAEAHALLLGPASQVNIRFRYPGATTWKVWSATISVGDQGGGNNDKTSWSVEFVRCGAPTTAAVV